MNDLTGKTAIVTGASKGIGAGIARAMGAAGAAVAVNYATDRAGADRTVSEILSHGGRARAIQGDVSSAADAKRVVDEAVGEFGSLHALVNNAAHFDFSYLGAITEEAFHRHFNVNVLGAILMAQQAVKHFDGSASITNISSGGILTPMPGSTLYGATKATLNMITQIWAKELGPRGIRVNSILPGATDTEGNRRLGALEDERLQRTIEKTALGRLGVPSDIAPAAVFLASDDAAWITGTLLNVSGGFG